MYCWRKKVNILNSITTNRITIHRHVLHYFTLPLKNTHIIHVLINESWKLPTNKFFITNSTKKFYWRLGLGATKHVYHHDWVYRRLMCDSLVILHRRQETDCKIAGRKSNQEPELHCTSHSPSLKCMYFDASQFSFDLDAVQKRGPFTSSCVVNILQAVSPSRTWYTEMKIRNIIISFSL